MPTLTLISSGRIPVSLCASSESWRCVVLAGCKTLVRESATCMTCAASFKEFMNFSASCAPPFGPKVKTPLQAFKYLSA